MGSFIQVILSALPQCDCLPAAGTEAAARHAAAHAAHGAADGGGGGGVDALRVTKGSDLGC